MGGIYITVNGWRLNGTEWADKLQINSSAIYKWMRISEEYAAVKIRERLKDRNEHMDKLRDVANAAFEAGMTYGKYVAQLQ